MAAEVSKMNGKMDTNSSDLAKSVEDLKMEYSIKYERFLNAHQEIQKAYVESQKNSETHKSAYKDFVNQLKKDVFDKEIEIYNLKQEIDNLKSKNEELELKTSRHETRKSLLSSKLDESRPDLSTMKYSQKSIIESPIVLSSIPKLDLASSLCLPETPRRVSKVRRFSVMNETIEKASPMDQGERDEFLKRIIMEQKELLDFYATMTGYMAWKENLPQELNDKDCNIDFFKMKPQKNELKDMEVQFLVDYEQDDIEYHPVGLPENQDDDDKFLECLREKLYLSTDVAPQLLKALLDVLKS